ncbi:hypothetical protein [Microbispora siamensis]|uniref:Uncharacterized protein n=1 Tax=Microbispora siamensis TaxID=564413 RepID=A0ABQ4GWA7_9ACTN|nr:hypothetical protein [Microbispora siamensis]GIH65726.1 hypothetical protein Msi02_65430 [Microbispora siamensis]
MTISLDEAARVGWAVEAFLNRPDLDGDDGSPAEVRIRALLRAGDYLNAVGLISETFLDRLRDFVQDTPTQAHKELDDTVGGVLLTVARYHPREGALDALLAVARAAVDGHAHGGPQGAQALAAIAAIAALARAQEPAAFAHKESITFAHKE